MFGEGGGKIMGTVIFRDKVKIIIGGAPITPEFAEEIGADAASGDAVEAVSICKSWIERKRGI